MRRGGWMLTSTRRQFWPLDPRAEEIDLGDIAHALARVCRFGGHCRAFYSVAQHSVHCARWVQDRGGDRRMMLWALLHDATEAYLGDVIRPLKELPEFAFYREAEDRLMATICERFGLAPAMPALVKQADNTLLATEKRDLMPESPPWPGLPDPIAETIKPWNPRSAEVEFLEMAHSLGAR